MHGYSNSTSVGDTKRLDILQWQVVVSLGEFAWRHETFPRRHFPLIVARRLVRVAHNGLSACQAAFTSKKAIKYLGMAWAQHPTVMWRSS